ncbi:MAG: glycosyltransferase [Candidatus Saccharimonadales bacterium]
MIKKNLPSLAVVVPVYNEAAHLPKCLDGLIKQLQNVNEIIIIDNNSSDESLTIARNYAKKYQQISVLLEPKQGLVPARNRGFRAAKSEIIARIDADTRVEPGWALAIRECFGANPDAAALDGRVTYYDLPCQKLAAKISSLIVNNSNRTVSGSASLYGPNMALSARVARQLLPISCTERWLNEDLDLTIHLRQIGGEIRYCPDMKAAISGRRLTSWPTNFWRYSLQWPRTYAAHGQTKAARAAYVINFFGCLGQTLICPILRAYDPSQQRLSWRQFKSRASDRGLV